MANLSLVAGTDSSGRGLCRQVDILDKKASDFEVYGITGSIGVGEDVAARVKDIRRIGKLQLVIDEDFTMDQGVAQCAASWPVIYAWTGGNYANVSAQFRDFYQQKLASLVAEMPKLPSGGPGSNPGDQGYEEQASRECLEAETAKIQRFLGVSRDSGMNEAIQWAKDGNPAKRVFAAEFWPTLGLLSRANTSRRLRRTLTRGWRFCLAGRFLQFRGIRTLRRTSLNWYNRPYLRGGLRGPN